MMELDTTLMVDKEAAGKIVARAHRSESGEPISSVTFNRLKIQGYRMDGYELADLLVEAAVEARKAQDACDRRCTMDELPLSEASEAVAVGGI